MPDDRHLDCGGARNARDLGGLPAAGGRAIRRGALVRADAPDRLTAAGWSALRAHGVRTIVDLRTDDERRANAPRPAGITTLHLPSTASRTPSWADWTSGPQFGTPLYYQPFLERFPQRTADVIAAIAHAPEGGVLVHCVGGRDRTGLITLLVLALVGVEPEDIAADYALSAERLRPLHVASGEPDEGAEIDAFLRDRGTSPREVILSILALLDVDAYLRAAGLGADDLSALRARLAG